MYSTFIYTLEVLIREICKSLVIFYIDIKKKQKQFLACISLTLLCLMLLSVCGASSHHDLSPWIDFCVST
jgi:hypothetical protein